MAWLRSTWKYPALLGGLLVFLAACSNFYVETPRGFAEIPWEQNPQNMVLYKAVSPEGIRFSVRKEENYPRMELDFWARALKNQLQKEGYTLIGKEQDFQAEQRNGVYFEWGLPYGNETYIYFTSLLVCDDELLVIEAAGEYTIFNSYKDAIITSLKSIKYK
jgi:hypothetical protein